MKKRFLTRKIRSQIVRPYSGSRTDSDKYVFRYHFTGETVTKNVWPTSFVSGPGGYNNGNIDRVMSQIRNAVDSVTSGLGFNAYFSVRRTLTKENAEFIP